MIKYILCFILFFNTLQIASAETNKVKFKTNTDVVKALKAEPGNPVQGPFELKILAISQSGFNTRLHTKKDIKDPENIIIELAPFMVQYYTKQFNTTIEQFFLNQVFAVNGKAISVQTSEDEQLHTEYVIKVFLANQLTHLQ
ncbi:MAG: hypothetical protein R3E90_16300 [Marinicella sp.]|nr:hypothetical protein [Xanthomonadales bacterium]